jgi:hypothetical protein
MVSGDGSSGLKLFSGGKFLFVDLLYSLNSSKVNSKALHNFIAIFYYS